MPKGVEVQVLSRVPVCIIRSMENQDHYIPEHLREEWGAVSRRLGEASIELVRANEEYRDAILARIAMSQELKDWQMRTYFSK